MAARMSSSLASGRPSVTFSRTLIENSVASSNAVATMRRRLCRVRSRVSTPSMVTRPAVASYSRGTSAGERRLAGPGGADDGDGLARRDVEVDVLQHELVGVGVVEVDVLEAQVAGWRASRSMSPPTMLDFVSKMSSTRSAAVMASCAIARMTPSDSIGQIS